MLQIKGHCNYFGETGFNIYSKGFFKALKNLYPNLYIRNFTSCDGEEITENDKQLVDEITLYQLNEKRFINSNPNWLSSYTTPSRGDLHIILNETNHCYFYNSYNGIKIAYNMWETTQQPLNFFNKLLEFDQVWVPSEWQKQMLLNQGFPKENLYVVPGGVDKKFVYIPKIDNNVRRFLIVGSWGFRKGTKEMIESFLKVFKTVDNVELILSVDSPYAKDGMTTTEERLKFYGLENPKIKIQHFTDRESYIKMIQNCDVLLACSRGEGWCNPLIEAFACGKPAIFSNCSGHLEYASKYPLKVEIEKEILAVCKQENINFAGNYYEPNWIHFEKCLLDVYDNFRQYTRQHIELSKSLREKYSWNNSAKIALKLLGKYLFKSNKNKQENEFYVKPNSIELLELADTTQNNFIYKEIFEYQVYNNIPEMKIQKEDVVVDVGAHIGIFSRYAAINGASRVISMEMNPNFFSCLRLNVRPEDDVFNCVLLHKALTQYKLENDILVIGFDLNHFYEGGLFKKIDFLKIDVSGKELILLYSIKQNIFDIIKKISVKMYNLSDDDKFKLIKFMKKIGFVYQHNILVFNQSIQFLYFWK